MAHFHHFSLFSQNQSISNLVIFEQTTKAIALLCFPNMAHFHHFSMFNQNQSIWNLVIFEQNTKAIALLFAQKWLNCHQSISLFTVQSKSINFTFGHFWGNHQGYSLTFFPNMAHFHHCSLFSQNQSISHLVIFEQNTKAIALLFAQKWLNFITFQWSIKINQFQLWSFLSKIPRL